MVIFVEQILAGRYKIDFVKVLHVIYLPISSALSLRTNIDLPKNDNGQMLYSILHTNDHSMCVQ